MSFYIFHICQPARSNETSLLSYHGCIASQKDTQLLEVGTNEARGRNQTMLAVCSVPTATNGFGLELLTQAKKRVSLMKFTKRNWRYISPQILPVDIWLDSDCVSEHPRHRVFPENNNFLVEELDPTWV